jgi:hypothetical protein
VVIGSMRRRLRNLAGAAVLTLSLLPATAGAATVQIDFLATGRQHPPGSEVFIFRADLAGSSLASIEALTIEDLGTGLQGATGIFTGFDLDAIFLDVDGNVGTLNDRHFATGYQFAVGSILVSGDPAHRPTGTRRGPVFGSKNGTTISHALATLDKLDAVSIADVNQARGFLSLGRGGVLTLLFDTPVPVGDSLFLIAGEVGGNGETLRAATLTGTPVPPPPHGPSAPAPVPGPAALPLLASGLGLLGWAGLRRGTRRRAATRTAGARPA